MSAPRVLHMIGGGDTGGAMAHLLPLLSALNRTECDAHLLCLGDGRLAREAAHRGLPVAVLHMGSAWDPSVLAPLRRVLAGGPAMFAQLMSSDLASRELASPEPVTHAAGESAHWDVVHTHGMRANLPARLVVHSLRQKPCLFTTVHSDLKRDYSSPLVAATYAGLDRLTLRSVDTVICVSDGLRALLLQRGYPAERLVTIRSGVESPGSEVAPAPETADSAAGATAPASTEIGRESIEGQVSRPRVGVVARLVPVKDIELLLEVTALLRRTIPGIEAVVVGDGPERERLSLKAQEYGLDGVVRFTGQLAEVAPVLADIDVYLVTSAFEGGVSMAVLEAMAAGIPVVTTAAGGVAEAVKDGETGFVVTHEQDRGALAAALAERAAALLTDPGLRARMGAAGARRVREQFLVERTAEATLRAYRRCLAAHGAL